MIKRLHAIQAAVKRLARGRAKVRCFGGVGRSALRAGHWRFSAKTAASAGATCAASSHICSKPHHRLPLGRQGRSRCAVGRGDAVGAQFFARLCGHPVGRPGGGQLRHHAGGHACARQGGGDVVMNLLHRRAAAVGGRDDHFHPPVGAPAQRAQDAHFAQGDHRNLGVGQLVQQRPEFGLLAF